MDGRARREDGVLALADHHLPTGHVTFGEVVRFLIAEVGVEPRRDDWDEVLTALSEVDPRW